MKTWLFTTHINKDKFLQAKCYKDFNEDADKSGFTDAQSKCQADDASSNLIHVQWYREEILLEDHMIKAR